MSTDTTPDQAAPPQSVADRIAAKFGLGPETPEDEPQVEAQAPAEDTPEEEAPADDGVDVEYDGTRYRVPKPLEKAIMQERDYTQKTQKVAETARLLEQSQSAMKLTQMERDFERETHEDTQQLAAVEQWMKGLNQRDFAQMSSDDKMDVLLQMRRAEEIRSNLKDTLRTKRGEFEQKIAKATDEVKAQAREVLAKQIPGYRPDDFAAVRQYAKSLGFTDVAIDSIEMDAKSALVIYKARQFDELQANKAAAVKKLDAPVVKPGATRPMPADVKQQLAFRKAMNSAKSSQEKARLIEERLAARAR